MPIRKRSTRPKASAPKVRVPSSYRQVALSDLVKKHDKLAEEAAWNGDTKAYTAHVRASAALRELIAEGQVWA